MFSGQAAHRRPLNGGTYNLVIATTEVVQAVTAAMQHFDIGNHHFPSLARNPASL